ncbi:MAG TPA: ISNCY family transposase, partial [Candidatus Limnocylindrales bacterium]
MTNREQQRAQVLTRLLVGDVTTAEAAILLGLSERQVFRLRRGLERDGPAALVHGNRGRTSSRRLAPVTAARIVALARTTYDGANDCHLAELLAEHEGIVIGRSSLRRLLRSAGLASPRRRRAPRHRSRRDRMPQAGMLLQVDGSRHDWLEGRGPRLTLVAGIDDATGRLTGAVFREQEDTAGYLVVLRDTVRRHGVPLAVYRDRHTLFEAPRGSLMTLEEQLADTRLPTQLGRAFDELGITSIAACSPQAKGRIERSWGTLQDRLVTELRLAGAHDLASADEVLARFLPRFNRRFAVPAADPAPAWRPLPAGTRIERVCCLKYRRVVANDHTVRAGATILQLPPGPGRRGYAGRRVEVQLRLDGRIVAWDGERELLTVPAPADPVQLRALEAARVEVGSA